MTKERSATRERKFARVRTSIPAEWGPKRTYGHRGTIISLSSRGCLVETGQLEALHPDTIHLRFRLPNGDWLLLQGEALYYKEQAFALKFTDLVAEDKRVLMELVRYFRERQ